MPVPPTFVQQGVRVVPRTLQDVGLGRTVDSSSASSMPASSMSSSLDEDKRRLGRFRDVTACPSPYSTWIFSIESTLTFSVTGTKEKAIVYFDRIKKIGAPTKSIR